MKCEGITEKMEEITLEIMIGCKEFSGFVMLIFKIFRESRIFKCRFIRISIRSS